MRLILSDEVEARFLLFEASINYWGCFTLSSSLTDKCCQPVGIADARWFLDRSRHVVVSVAEFIGEKLNLIRSLLNIVIDDCELGGCSHALLGCNGNKVEFVGALVNDLGVDDSTSSRVSEAADSTSEDSSVYAFTCVDIHDLAVNASRLDSSFNLLYLRYTDSLNLAFTDTISVEDETGGISTIVRFEGSEGIFHTILEVVCSFLTNLILSCTSGPVSCCRLVHRGSECKDRFLAKSSGVEDIHTHDHGRSTHER